MTCATLIRLPPTAVTVGGAVSPGVTPLSWLADQPEPAAHDRRPRARADLTDVQERTAGMCESGTGRWQSRPSPGWPTEIGPPFSRSRYDGALFVDELANGRALDLPRHDALDLRDYVELAQRRPAA